MFRTLAALFGPLSLMAVTAAAISLAGDAFARGYAPEAERSSLASAEAGVDLYRGYNPQDLNRGYDPREIFRGYSPQEVARWQPGQLAQKAGF